jgi:uncharacterized membrane protein
LGSAFVYVTALVLRYAGHPVENRLVILTALLLVAGYVAEEFRYGNFHFFVVAMMAVAFVSAERGRVALPAASLALAIAAKLTPLLLLGYFALLLASPHTRRRYFISLYIPMLALLVVMRRQPDAARSRVVISGLVATAAASTVLPIVFRGAAPRAHL